MDRYRPVGPDPNPDLALTPAQQRKAREFVVNMRCKKPIIIIDAYYDADGNALCPAATGFTHHISPWGDIEPCPIIQFAKESIHDERPLDVVFNESEYLRDFRKTAAEHTRGCIALERPDLIQKLVDRPNWQLPIRIRLSMLRTWSRSVKKAGPIAWQRNLRFTTTASTQSTSTKRIGWTQERTSQLKWRSKLKSYTRSQLVSKANVRVWPRTNHEIAPWTTLLSRERKATI